MPGNSTAIYTDGKTIISFTENTHSYIDSNNKIYTSVTTLLNCGFEKFDAVKAAQLKAEKTGIDPQILLDQWKEIGEKSRNRGTRLHENCEKYILSEEKYMNKPENDEEKLRFDSAYAIIDNIKKKYRPVSIEPEKIVFSPRLLIAGSIDLLIKLNDMDYIIGDWKVLNKDIAKEGFNGKTGIIPPTRNIQDSNYWHYALQLQIYENLLKCEEYVNPKSRIRKMLIVWNGSKFTIEQLPDISDIAWKLIAYFKGVK